jgi:hypothetical protein
MENHTHAPAKAVHNMALFGDRHIFLSHLPMFMPPHSAQAVLEATFLKDGQNVDAIYFADRASHPAVRFYTVQPESFAIQELFQPAPTQSPRTHFRATVFRGHLEKGGVPLESLQSIDVQVTRVVHARTLEGATALPTLTYFLAGEDTEFFLVHLLSAVPDFDQILSVTVSGGLPPTAELQRGLTVEVPGRTNKSANRLQPKETVPVQGRVAGAPQALTLKVDVKAELYFEEGELSSTKMTSKMFETTPAEKKAGFE